MSNLTQIKSMAESLSDSETNELLFFLAGRDKVLTDDILSSLVSKVSTSIPEIENMSEASKAKRLLKIFSLLIYEYNHLTYNELYNNFFIHSATAEFLDEYGKEIGLSRHLMTKAMGKIRLGSQNEVKYPVSLPSYFTVSTKETEDRQALKYTPIRELIVSFSSSGEPDESEGEIYWSEDEIEIESIERGSIYNLDEGQITEVLTKRSPFDYVEQVGVISSAYDREGDISFRRRILEAHRSGNELSSGYFISKAKEKFPAIDEVLVRSSPNGPGSLGLIIKAVGDSTIIRRQLEDFWNNSFNKMLDYRVVVELAKELTVDIEIRFFYTDRSIVSEADFSESINNYFASLSVASPFVREYLEKDIADLCQRQGIMYFETLKPLSAIIIPKENEYCVLGSKIFELKEYGRDNG